LEPTPQFIGTWRIGEIARRILLSRRPVPAHPPRWRPGVPGPPRV